MGVQRAVLFRRQLQFPSRCQETCKNDTAESISEFFHAAEREMRREPEVPEAGVPVVERLDGLARITSEELAPNHQHTS